METYIYMKKMEKRYMVVEGPFIYYIIFTVIVIEAPSRFIGFQGPCETTHKYRGIHTYIYIYICI